MRLFRLNKKMFDYKLLRFDGFIATLTIQIVYVLFSDCCYPGRT